MAAEGYRPVCAIYSTFLQRAFDHIMHDVALQNLPVVFCMDRAGIAGEDGPTHHGCLDLAYLSIIPGMVVSAPKDGDELGDLLFTALAWDGPFAIRFPKGSCGNWTERKAYSPLPVGKWERLQAGETAAVLAVGSMVETAVEVAQRLATEGISLEIINARFIKPLDSEMLTTVVNNHQVIFTLEEGCLPGGFGAAILQQVNQGRGPRPRIHCLGLADEFIPHGPRSLLLDRVGLSAPRLEKTMRDLLDGRSQPESRSAETSTLATVIPGRDRK
jgi:1-deoxy-D-xylulose-5-phosphate synthase